MGGEERFLVGIYWERNITLIFALELIIEIN